jgi:ATP-binding cassette subfamily C (CFTR/MRP) protein 1
MKAAIAVFAAVQLALVVLWATQPRVPARQASISASSLSLVTSLMLCALSYLEHSKSLRPSILINAYLFMTLLFDATMVRTLWLAPFNNAIRNSSTASFALKGVILVLEAREKPGYFNFPGDKQRSPEEFGGLYNQCLFWWLNSVMMQGFRHILKPDDLYPVVYDMSSERLNEKFWKTWNKCKPDVTRL